MGGTRSRYPFSYPIVTRSVTRPSNPLGTRSIDLFVTRFFTPFGGNKVAS